MPLDDLDDDLETFRAEIWNFLLSTNMARSTFGRLAAGTPNFVYRMDRKEEPKRRTIARVREFMANYEEPKPKRRKKLTVTQEAAIRRKKGLEDAA